MKYFKLFSGKYEDVIKCIDKAVALKNELFIIPLNTELAAIAMQDKEFCQIVCDADIRTPDGTGIVWISRLFGQNISERITGADLAQEITKAAGKKRWKLFFLGAAPGIAEHAKKKLAERFENPQIKTYSPPFGDFSEAENKKIIKLINSFKTNILFVAFGAPKQEKWISMYKKELRAQVFLPVGGTFDFIAGKIKRAPKFIQRIGLEWLYRIYLEPKRLKRVFKTLVLIPNMAIYFRKKSAR